MKKVVQGIDAISEFTGKIAGWGVLITILILVFEVIMRFVFNSPTFWGYNMSYMVGGASMALGAAYALKKRAHVRVDVIYDKFPEKGQAITDIVVSLILFFPLFIIGLVEGIEFAALSWERQEQVMSGGYWKPYIYPFKTFVPIAFALLLLQGIADFIRNIYKLRGREL
jgi:TRAP-type mannitol/chloroaromatic compound transport system permease small subunit